MFKRTIEEFQTIKNHIQKNKVISAVSSSPATLVFLTVLVVGSLTHGYAFFNSAFTFDSLNALYADPTEHAWKISLGRFFIPVYQSLFRGNYAAPWLVGCLSLLWLGLAYYLIIRMFDMKSPVAIILTGGILITNMTVSLTAATFIHDLDVDMLALLMAVIAAWRWKKNPQIDLLSIICISVALGLYQAYISVFAMLVIMQCILDILQDKRIWPMIRKGIAACITLALGALVYIGFLWIARHVCGYSVSTTTGNGMQNVVSASISSLLQGVLDSYTYIREDLFYNWRSVFSSRTFKILHILLVICACGNGLLHIADIKRNVRKALLLLIPLLLIIPPVVYLSVILSSGASHHQLMLYALWLIYLLLLLITSLPPAKAHAFADILRAVSAVVFAICIWGNIRTANSLYLIKDMQSEAITSLYTRILYRMESSEEYAADPTTPVAFIGASPLIDSYFPGGITDYYWGLFGMHDLVGQRLPSYAYDPIYKLAKFRLGNPLVLCDDNTYYDLCANPAVLQMSNYPDHNCMKMVDGVFVVKLSEPSVLPAHPLGE